MKSRLLIAFLLLFYIYNAFAQNNTINSYNLTEVPKYIPPTPEMSALFRYQDLVVNHSSGVPEISIPIYEIKCGSLSIPISIVYDASGRRASDETGTVGLGWSLQAGAIISRTIKSKDDLRYPVKTDKKRTANQINESRGKYEAEYPWDVRKQDYELLKGAAENMSKYSGATYDLEYDIFSYIINNQSGSFIMNGQPQLLDNKPLKIWYVGSSKFNITDDKGNLYKFIPTESYSGIELAYTGWRLEELQSADSQYSITFKYLSPEMLVGTNGPDSYNLQITDNNVAGKLQGGRSDASIEYSTAPSSISYNISRPIEIDFGSGKVTFILEKDTNKKIKKITDIIVSDLSENQIKHCRLIYDSNNIGGVERLIRMEWLDSSENIVEKHQLFYNDLINPSIGKDYWGFVNNRSSFTYRTAFPYFSTIVKYNYLTGLESIMKEFGSKTQRLPDTQSIQSGILNKIIYPSGGYSSFIYEGNKYYDIITQKIEDGPGIRIKEIRTSDGLDSLIEKLYKYGENESGYGTLKISPYQIMSNLSNISRSITIQYAGGGISKDIITKSSQNRVYSSDYTGDISFFTNLPVFYNQVTEYINSTQINKTTKTIYEYIDRYRSSTYSKYPPINQHSLIIYKQDGAYLNTIIWNELNDHLSVSSDNFGWYGNYYDFFWKSSNLISKTEYINKGNNIYTPLKKTINTYKETPLDTINNIKVNKIYSIQHSSSSEMESSLGEYTNIPIYSCTDYSIVRGKSELIGISEILYSDEGDIQSDIKYVYNDYGLIKSSENNNSNRQTIKEDIKYSFENNDAVSKKMTSLNMLNFPIEKTKKTNENSETIYINYKDFSTNSVRLSQISSKKNNSELENRIIYHNYDIYGNPTHISKDDTNILIYLWSYHGQYPIAEIRGATYDQVELAVKAEFGVTNIDALSKLATPDVAKLQKLRLNSNLKGAHVTTYTYQPLVGMTTMTDPTGVTIAYEYDLFGRLKRTKDQNGKTIQEYDYHYRNQ